MDTIADAGARPFLAGVVPTGTAQRPADTAATAASDGQMQDEVAGSAGPRGPGMAQMAAFFQRRAGQERSIDGMLARDSGLPEASASERQALEGELSHVEPDVLQYAHERGVKIQVLHPGDDLEQAKVLRDQDPARLQQQMPAMAKLSARLDASMKQYDAPLADLQQQRDALLKRKGLTAEQAALPFGLGGKPDPQLSELDGKIFKLQGEKNRATAQALDHTDLPVDTFHYPMGPEAGPLANMTQLMAAQPTSLQAMAQVHGASTPQDDAEFYKDMQGINGERLQTAQADGLHHAEQMLRAHPNPEFQKIVDDMRQHPEKIPIDHRKYNILVPDRYFYRPPGAPSGTKPLRLDEHDFGTLQQWDDAKTGRVAPLIDPNTGQGSVVLGQYFAKGGVNRIVVRDQSLHDGTAIHELGHAVDFNVEKDDPAFYGPWHKRLDQAYHNVDAPHGTQAISAYSRTNEREYLAEGFRVYHTDPKMLKAKDPALYLRVQELVDRAGQLSR